MTAVSPLAPLVRAARERAAALDVPSSRLEDWRYVRLGHFAQFRPDEPRDVDGPAVAADLLGGLAEGALVLVDGVPVSDPAALPGGLSLEPAPELVAAWHDALDRTDLVEAWSLADLRTAATLHLSGAVERPIVIVDVITGGTGGGRLTMDAAPGAAADVVLVQVHAGRARTSRGVDVAAGADSALRIDELEIGLEDPASIGQAFATKRVRAERGAQVKWSAAVSGGELVRHAWRCDLAGEGAHVDLTAGTLVDGDRQCHHLVRMRHLAGNAYSRQVFKTVVDDRALASFDGLIFVAEGADGTDALQSSNNLQITPRARIATRPQLDVYADEVQASHGATVGQPDAEEIAYLRSRGLDPRLARALIIEGFVVDALDHLVQPAVRAVAERHLVRPLRG